MGVNDAAVIPILSFPVFPSRCLEGRAPRTLL